MHTSLMGNEGSGPAQPSSPQSHFPGCDGPTFRGVMGPERNNEPAMSVRNEAMPSAS